MTDQLKEMSDTDQFLQLVARGVGELNAAITVGWTPAKLKKLKKDKDFEELIVESRLCLMESVEEKEYELALRGNQRAIEMVLFCKGADRGWHPPTQKVSIERKDTVRIELVQATVAAAKELLTQNGTVAALQAGVIEATAHDD